MLCGVYKVHASPLSAKQNLLILTKIIIPPDTWRQALPPMQKKMNDSFKDGRNYVDEVIRPLLPNAQFERFIQNNYFLFGPDQLRNSRYDRPIDDDTYFLHLTSVTKLLEIIRSKTIRMSDFNSFKDKFELTYANNNLVENKLDFKNLKSCLFALSMCEDTEKNRRNEYMWEKYGDNHKGVIIRLKLDKCKSVFLDFCLGKIQYNETNNISELNELKVRHNDFKMKYGKAIDNLDTILLSACSMYKKKWYKKENEIRLLAYVWKNQNEIHPKNHFPEKYPIRHRYNPTKEIIEYFMELKLEHENANDKCSFPYLSIDEIILGHDLIGGANCLIRGIILDEFEKYFNREINVYYN